MKTNQDKTKANFNRWIVIVLVSLFAASVTGLIILRKYFTLADKSFGGDVGNMFLQIISVGVVGTILSLLLAKHQASQEKAVKKQELERISNENKNQFKKDIIHQLNQIYSNTKSVRRILRARAFTTNYLEAFEKNDAAMNLEVYDNALEQINSFQLELEMIVKELESNGRSFSDASSLRVNITKMENYLGEIVSEYEENRIKGFENNSIAMQHLKEIKTLIEHTVDKSAFRLQFIEPYKVAVGAIRRELLLENHS